MDPSNFIKKEHIILELKSKTQIGILKEMLEPFIRSGDILAENKETLVRELLDREAKGSTAIGNSIAIPHCKTVLVDRIMASVALKKEGADFKALDNKPVHIFILTLSPKQSSTSHIQFLALVSNIFQAEKNRQAILNLTSREAIYDFLVTKGKT